MAWTSSWKSVRSSAKKELKFRCGVFVLNILICIMALVTIGVSVDVYLRQKSLVWKYVEPSVNPPVLVVGISCLLILVSATLGFYASYRFELRFLKVYSYALILEIVVALLVAFLVMFLFGASEGIEVFENKFKFGVINYVEQPITKDSMDEAQQKLHCCGKTGYKDWNLSDSYSCSDNSKIEPRNCSVPDSCCIQVADGCGSNLLNFTDNVAKEKIYTEGCVAAVEDIVQHNAFIVGSLCLVLFVFLAAEAILITIYIRIRQQQLAAAAQIAD